MKLFLSIGFAPSLTQTFSIRPSLSSLDTFFLLNTQSFSFRLTFSVPFCLFSFSISKCSRWMICLSFYLFSYVLFLFIFSILSSSVFLIILCSPSHSLFVTQQRSSVISHTFFTYWLLPKDWFFQVNFSFCLLPRLLTFMHK